MAMRRRAESGEVAMRYCVERRGHGGSTPRDKERDVLGGGVYSNLAVDGRERTQFGQPVNRVGDFVSVRLSLWGRTCRAAHSSDGYGKDGMI